QYRAIPQPGAVLWLAPWHARRRVERVVPVFPTPSGAGLAQTLQPCASGKRACSCWRTLAQRYHFAALCLRHRGDEHGPLLHKFPAPLEQISTPITALDLAADVVGQTQLDHVVACAGALVRPVTKR